MTATHIAAGSPDAAPPQQAPARNAPRAEVPVTGAPTPVCAPWFDLRALLDGRAQRMAAEQCRAVPAPPRRVAVIGDSIAFNFQGRLARSLQAFTRPGALCFVNEARGSETTSGLLGQDAVKGIRCDRMQEILRRGYDEVVLEIGINELASGWSAERLVEHVRQLCEMAMDAGVQRIVLLEVLPWKGFHKWTPEKAVETVRYNELIAQMARECDAEFQERGCGCRVQLVPLAAAMADAGDPEALALPARYPGRSDGLHPGYEGIDAMAEQIVAQAYLGSTAIEFTPEAKRLRALRRELGDLRRRIAKAQELAAD